MGEPEMKVVVTGGLAPLFAGSSPDLALVDTDLTLRGLKILHDRNADARPPRRA
jgi:type III pantothenate kinase